ncbi:MAG TPA: UDP-2,3-diacylglucosamine diphosphatase [Xanthomonadaceae bacterium]|nr:UDP-2,3-diacylglucosamine diphosphatase [Xanthomonadaceae bacterium]
MATLLISDLHLDESRPQITELFGHFLAGEARRAADLFVLGDLFESWVGDDEDSALAATVCKAFRSLVEDGVPVRLIRGNRDFLIGAAFAARSGVQVIADPSVLLLGGVPTLLLHGDQLCTDDLEYQKVRAQVRDPDWQARFLEQPLAERRAFAGQARDASRAHQAGLAPEIGDVADATVRAWFALYGVPRMIHGHTHRPAIHRLQVEGSERERVVLGDWYEQGSVLCVEADGSIELRTLAA